MYRCVLTSSRVYFLRGVKDRVRARVSEFARVLVVLNGKLQFCVKYSSGADDDIRRLFVFRDSARIHMRISTRTADATE